MTRIRRVGAARIAYLAAFATSMLGSALAMPYLGLHLAPEGASDGVAYGVGVGVSAATALVANPVAARLARRLGPMTTFAAGVLLQGVGLAIVELLQSTVLGVLAGFAVSGIGSGAAFGTATAALVQRFGRPALPGVFAAQGMLANVATAVAGVAASAVVSVVGARAYGAFVWAAVAGYAVLSAVLAAIARRMARDGAGVGVPGRPRSPFAGLRDPRFRAVLAVQLLVTALVMAQLHRVYPLAWSAAGIDAALVGALFSVNAVLVLVLQLPALGLARRLGPRSMLLAASLAVLASLATVALVVEVAPLAAAAAGVMLLSVAEVGITTSLQPLVVAASPPDAVIEYAADASLVASLALVVAPAAGIAVLAASPWCYWVGSAVAAVLLVVVTARLRTDGRWAHA